MNTIAARDELAALDYDVIPIAPGDKRPLAANWQTLAPDAQWAGAPPDANLGLRCGGPLQLAILDADDKTHAGSAAAVGKYLAALGLYHDTYPMHRTPNGGTHALFVLADPPPHGHARRLAHGVAGELRYGPGAQVVAPPSTLADGRAYTLAGGDYRQLPRLEWADLADLLANPDRTPPAAVMPTSAALPDAANLPGDVMRRLEGLGGDGYDAQNDFATVYRLAGLGYSLDEITMLLLAYPGYGHVSELCARNPHAAAAWLAEAYAKALAYLATHGDAAAKMQKLAAHAQAAAWPGRTGAYDRAVYLAHLGIGIDAGAPEWAGGVRRLAEHANIGRETAGRATGRLVKDGLLRLVKPATPLLAATYTLPTPEENAEGLRENALTRTLLYDGNIKKCPTTRVFAQSTPDLFVWHGLGLAAYTIYEALATADEPQEDTDIVASSGRCLGTVRRLLAKMADLGLVVCHPAGWLATGRAGPSLTPAGQAVWDALAGADGPQAVKVLAASSGRCLGTVRRHLGALAALGMAMYTPGGWAVTSKSLDSVAADLGVLGKRQERRKRHLWERQRQRQHLEYYRTHPIPRRNRTKQTTNPPTHEDTHE